MEYDQGFTCLWLKRSLILLVYATRHLTMMDLLLTVVFLVCDFVVIIRSLPEMESLAALY